MGGSDRASHRIILEKLAYTRKYIGENIHTYKNIRNNNEIMGAGRAHDFISISYILICMYIFPYIFAIFARKLLGNPLGKPLGKPLGNPLGNWYQIGTPCRGSG